MQNLQLSIIVPTLNRGKVLCNTLLSLVQQLPESSEIIVVDQSPTIYPDLKPILTDHQNSIRYFRLRTKGLPHARNFGLKKAKGSVVLYCDDDIIPGPTFIQSHLEAYQNTEIGGVGGRILVDSDLTTISSLPKEKRKPPIGKINPLTIEMTDHFDSQWEADIDHCEGCNMSFRRDLLLKIGGFDERFGGSARLEETDVWTRIQKLGVQLRFAPKAALIHLKDPIGGCRPKNAPHWFRWYGHNYMLYFLKNYSKSLLPIFFLNRVFRLILSALKRKNPAIFIWGMEGLIRGIETYKNP